MIITTNQKIALTDAQLQPSASNSPKKARRRAGACGRGAGRVVSAIALAPDRERAGHVRMDVAHERVAARGQRPDVVVHRREPREDVALEDGRAARVLDLDVVRDARVLVLEHDLE